MVKTVEKTVKDKNHYLAYRNDVETRLAFRRRIVVSGLMLKLHRDVGLRSGQRAAAMKLAARLFDQDRIDAMSAGSDLLLETNDGKALASVLDKAQLQYLRTFSAEPAFLIDEDDQPKKQPTPEQRREELRTTLKEVAKMKIQQLDAELKLTQKQSKRLQLVSKGVIGKLVGKRLAAEDKLDIPDEIIGMNDIGTVDIEAMDVAFAGVVSLFVSDDKLWNRRLNAILTESQRAKWQEFQKPATRLGSRRFRV